MRKLTMTKVQTLRACRDQWDWIAEQTWGGNKSAYFDSHPKLKRPAHNCFCCEYVNELVGKDYSEVGMSRKECEIHCPLAHLWGGEEVSCSGTSVFAPCERIGTPYTKWKATCSSIHAKAIADLCRKALASKQQSKV